MLKIWVSSLVFLMSWMVPRAYAAETSAPRKVTVDTGIGTDVPVMIGVESQVELPYRILLSGGLGWMPAGYVDLINSILTEADAYDDNTATLIASALKDSMILRLSAGFRPFPKLGLEVTAGYTLATLGGGVSASDAIEATTGLDVPEDSGQEIPIESTLHNIHIGVDYRFVLYDHFVIRPSISYLQCVSSSTVAEINSQTPLGRRVADAAASSLESYLNSTYVTYVKTPVVGLFAEYRF